MSKIAVALSGGVDSGTSAALLLDRGCDVFGIFMRHRRQSTLSEEETRNVLATKNPRLSVFGLNSDGVLKRIEYDPNRLPFLLLVDAASAIDVANFLNVGLVLLDVDRQFESIVDNYVDEYYAARTPNPCVLCNRTIKFGLLLNAAKQLGADALATGHYVRKVLVGDWHDRTSSENRDVDAFFNYSATDYESTPEWLTKDVDSVFFARSASLKDQSYFLYDVDFNALNFIEFPIGLFEKKEVRRIASEKGLPVAARKDSQEICFVPDKGRLQFIRDLRDSDPERRKRLPNDTSGPFVSLDGAIIGEHSGYEKYTVGQRKGLGMGFGERAFVQRIVPESRGVVLGPYEELGVDRSKAINSNWHADAPIERDFRCEVKVRYRNESRFATVRIERDGSFEAVLDAPHYGVAPGQSLVCSWRDRLLGGGRITR